MTQLQIRPPFIYIKTDLYTHDLIPIIKQPIKWDGRRKLNRTLFTAEALINIKRGLKNTTIEEGQEHIDKLKDRFRNMGKAKDAFASPENTNQAVAKKTFPVRPFEHQLKGMSYLHWFNGAALFAEPGVGKTFMILGDIILKIEQGLIEPRDVLIASKLATLFSGWQEDAEKFVGLDSSILWEPSKVKMITGDIIDEIDHGPKPESSLPEKIRTKIRKVSARDYNSGSSKDRLPDHGPTIRLQHRWKEKGDQRFGIETVRRVATDNVSLTIIRKRILNPKYISIINHEGLLRLKDELRARKFKYVVIDESTAIKNPHAKVFTSLMEISEHAMYRRILSGTPSPQGPQDLWSQFYFLDEGLTLGPHYKSFMEENFDMVSIGSRERGTFCGVKHNIRPDGKNGKPGTLETIDKALKHRVFIRKLRDCVDLPPTTTRVLDIILDDTTAKHYKSMQDKFYVELDNETIDVDTAMAKLAKLRQLSSGFIINSEGKYKKTKELSAKMETLLDFTKSVGDNEKILIFAVFRCEIEDLLERFKGNARAIYGGASDKEKLKAQEDFKTDPAIKYLICQPQSAAYGINGLTVARYLVFYTMDYRYDTNFQAIRRIERTGQKRHCHIVYLIGKNTIDETVYKVVMKKKELQEKITGKQLIKEIAKEGKCTSMNK